MLNICDNIGTCVEEWNSVNWHSLRAELILNILKDVFSQGFLITRFQILLRLKLRTNNMRRGKYFEAKNVNTMEHKISWICV